MNPDLSPVEARVAQALRAHAETVRIAEVPPPPELPAAKRRGAPLAAGVAVLSVLLVTAVAWPFPHAAQPAAGPATLPARLAGHSFLTGAQSDAPIGRAIALYDAATGHEDFTFTQQMLAGADADRFRRLDLPQAMADDTPTTPTVLLAPDGTRVAVGTAENVQVMDLASAKAHRYPVDGYAALRAWSPDGRRLAFFSGLTQTRSGYAGTLHLLDLATGSATPIYRGPANAVAFDPQGRSMAVQADRDVLVLDIDGRQLRTLTLPDRHDLAGMAAWSPDGALLATLPSAQEPAYHTASGTQQMARNVMFVDATGTGAAVPAPVAAGAAWWERAVLGWRSPTNLLISDSSAGPDATTFDLIVDVSLADGKREVVSRFAVDGGSDYAIQQVQLATGLLPDVAVRPAGGFDRGPWPTWARVTGAIAAVILLAILALVAWFRLGARPASAGRSVPA